jgi:hypothetical protein
MGGAVIYPFKDPNHHPRCPAHDRAGAAFQCRCRGPEQLFSSPDARELSIVREDLVRTTGEYDVLVRLAQALMKDDPRPDALRIGREWDGWWVKRGSFYLAQGAERLDEALRVADEPEMARQVTLMIAARGGR